MKNPIQISMKRNLKSTIIQCLTIILVTFLFFSTTIQYFLVGQGLNKIGSYYKSIGYLKPIDEGEWYITEAKEVIKDDPLIEFYDNRRMTSAISDLYSAKIYLNNYFTEMKENNYSLSDSIFRAKIKESKTIRAEKYNPGGIKLDLIQTEQYAGFPELFRQDRVRSMYFNTIIGPKRIENPYYTIENRNKLLNLEPGAEYIFRGFLETSGQKKELVIIPLFEGGPLCIKADEFDENNPNLMQLFQDIKVINKNIHTFDVTATKDMSCMPLTQDSSRDYFIVDGR